MRKLFRVFLVFIVFLIVAGGGAAVWAKLTADSRLERRHETHRADLQASAPSEESVARGKHLVEARYACIECHGADFGGGTMLDAMPVARLFGPNLTGGKGSVVLAYTMVDWDRIVRHGVLPDGRPALMPSEDFFEMSDQELSDIVAYIGSMPPVDRPSRPRELGPVGLGLLALGKLRLSAEHRDHQAPHAALPPETAITVDFGKHLTHLCTGCHGQDLAGGPIVGGAPDWPSALNITPHEDGLAGWSYRDFVTALRESKRKDGSPLRIPMTFVQPYARRMTDVELEAMWKYLQTVAPRPSRT